MPRYIDADWLLERAVPMGWSTPLWVTDIAIKDAPTADVVEVKRGKWIKNEFYADALMCSCCKAYLDKEDWSRHYFYFCYHCGAFMEGMDDGTDMEKQDG